MYCEKCCMVTDGDRCPACGGKKLRPPEPGDPCFLTELDCLSAGILEDVLKQDGIPLLKKNVLGAGLAISVGPMLERYRFYVPYERLPEAAALAEELFPGTEQPG